MFSYGSGDYPGLLLFSFANNKFSHDAAVVIIQMTDRFIQKRKSKGWQSARIKATRCCCPNESLPAFTFSFLSESPSFLEEG